MEPAFRYIWNKSAKKTQFLPERKNTCAKKKSDLVGMADEDYYTPWNQQQNPLKTGVQI